MGKVFLARDTKLRRDSAIEVLPEAFASDEERMKGFAREAEVLASLNHPKIAAIYGPRRSSFSARASRRSYACGSHRPRSDPARRSHPAKQIAEALKAALEQGIIHRDDSARQRRGALHLLMIKQDPSEEDVPRNEIQIVLNWFEELQGSE